MLLQTACWLLVASVLASTSTQNAYNSANSSYRLPNCHKFEYQLAKSPVEYQKNCITEQLKAVASSLDALSEWNMKLARGLLEFADSDEPIYQMKHLKEVENCRDFLNYMFRFAMKYPRSGSQDFSEMERFLRGSVQSLISDFFDVFNLIKNYDNALFFRGFHLKASFFGFFKNILNKLTPLIEAVAKCRRYTDFLEQMQQMAEYLAICCEFRSLFLSNLRLQVQF